MSGSGRAWLDSHRDREAEPAIAGRVEGLSLEPVRRYLELLGDPQRAYPSIHITGTNGKGSTAVMVDALLRAQGLSVGRYSSPHLERVNERLVRDGEAIGDTELDAVLAELQALEPIAGLESPATWFELLTVAAFGWFADVAVDVAVVEVGLLGRYDATNVVDAPVAVVTNIGRDHTDGAVAWRARVAEEKVGIAGPGSTLLVGDDSEDLRDVFEAVATAATWFRGEDFGCIGNEVAVGGRLLDLRTPGAAYDEVFLPLHGAHHGDNAAIAIAAVEAFFSRPLEVDVVREALMTVSLPGRSEVVGRAPLVLLDGAHNPDGASALAETLRTDFPPAPVTAFVLGALDGRDPGAFVEALAPGVGDVVVATTAPGPRGLPASELAEAIVAPGLEVEAVPDVADAVGRALALVDGDDRVVVTGSLHLVGAAREVCRSFDLEAPVV